ncbi:uncharacterized protein LOC122076566 isoform X3 [Macadamia integrifolia]|uniref:uncharacterized protein LOC122076566 isoform X3 n=1 Tax=Macadamia integrifolia TaxID=60698 RepID=UPI001C4E3B29|nr:uncharacterized protein LOC122076566 isoform X3 [Macadamia integrifolia]
MDIMARLGIERRRLMGGVYMRPQGSVKKNFNRFPFGLMHHNADKGQPWRLVHPGSVVEQCNFFSSVSGMTLGGS